ncbi:MAG: YibE/F family protein [Eubacteriales bacterium]|nr:YibE/F family protein [Eubacteriales bacterium]
MRECGGLTKGTALRLLLWAAAGIGLLLFTFWINDVEKLPLISRQGQTFEKARVLEILQDNTVEDGTRVGEQLVRVELLTGEKKGEQLDITSSAGYLFGAPCRPGMKVIVMQSVAGDTAIASVYTQDRAWVLYLFGILYLGLLVLIGGKQGVKGGLGLVFTFFSILLWYLPMVYRGFSPFWSAVFICAITTLVTMLLIGGFTKKAAVATVGTVGGVLTAGLVATAFSLLSGLSGYNVSDIETLMTLWNTLDIQVGSLLFSGLLISSLGAVMDVAMSVASSMSEILAQNPGMTMRELFAAGLRVGRDMMGTDSNTLILAFAGSSVSMLLLNYSYALPYLQVINSNNIGIAVMQGLAGSFGVVLSVPITVAAAALLYSRK